MCVFREDGSKTSQLYGPDMNNGAKATSASHASVAHMNVNLRYLQRRLLCSTHALVGWFNSSQAYSATVR